jgi:uncharacterized protein YciW
LSLGVVVFGRGATLLDAGCSTTDIVTMSQIAAFLSFQIRVVAGLRALAGAA